MGTALALFKYGGYRRGRMRLRIVMHGQDDPKKCTALRLVRLGLARRVRAPGGRSMVLDPFAGQVAAPPDRKAVSSVTAVDCSWRLAEGVFATGARVAGLAAAAAARRRLPPLLAGNPVNYSKVGKLTTAEALAGALCILGFGGKARDLLAKFPWGHTFAELNGALLEDYARARDADGVAAVASEYGLA